MAAMRALLEASHKLIAEMSQRLSPQPTSTLTFGALHGLYEAARKRTKSWKTAQYMLRPPLREWRDHVAASLRVSDWTEVRTKLEDHYAPTTLNQILDWVKAMLRWGVEQGLLPEEPHVCRARWAKCKRARETSPGEDDISKMLALKSCDAKRRVFLLCDVDAGMRVSEIKQLQWPWLNRERMEIHIPNWAAKGGSGGVTQMTRRLLEAIEAIPRDLRTPYVLTHETKAGPRLYTRQTLSDWWKELAREAGIQAVPGERRVHAHDGRGAFATRAADQGVPVEVIQGMLRHKRLETTVIYLRKRRQRQLAGLADAREKFERGIEKDRSK